MEEAPYFADVARGPDRVHCVWINSTDGTRLRAAYWPGGDKGTVVLFPGRTEYVEKYGPAAIDLAHRGYSTVSIDWRGQGLADRLLDNTEVGHARDFGEFQHDAAALVATLQDLGASPPFHLMAHSMGGCIGLRTLLNDHPFDSAVFSAPMWGINLNLPLYVLARTLSVTAHAIGQGHRYVPGSSGDTSFLLDTPFKDNLLTTDAGMYDFLQNQVRTHPELSLGGPSMGWLHNALSECQVLMAAPAPDLPTLVFCGTEEAIVSKPRIQRRVANWPSAELVWIDGARHEVMMETPAMRAEFFDRSVAHFDANAS